MELLAPAGSLSIALAAFDAGADAVYCGLKKFNARERGENFTPDDMSKLIANAHKLGKKVYITFNTLVKESELDSAADALAELDMLRPDALIVQDIGIVRMIREFFPHLTIHGSTQMAIHDSPAVETARKMGIRRVILERQITLEELELLAKNSPLELEIFVHGALCACLSGTCLFSSWLGGFSGNRGKCKQPCRRMFRSDRGKNAFYLSTRDLAAIELIPKFRELGIASLKIEGRLRKADYVAGVVSAYRLALDSGDSASASEILDRTCARERSLGFYSQDSMKHLVRADVPGGVGQYCGKVTRVFRDAFEAELTNRIHIGDNIRIQSASGDEGEALTVLEMSIGARPVRKAFPGQLCRIASRGKNISAGGILYKIGQTHDTMEKRCANLPLRKPLLDLELSLNASGIKILAGGKRRFFPLELRRAEQHAVTAEDLQSAFRSGGLSVFASGNIAVRVENGLFLPQSTLKTIRRDFWKWADETFDPEQPRRDSMLRAERAKTFHAEMKRHDFFTENPIEFLSEGEEKIIPEATAARDLSAVPTVGEECILPIFTPENRIPDLKRNIEALVANGIRVFRAVSLSHFSLLSGLSGIRIKTAPPLPAANAFAVLELQSLGADTAMAHIELSKTDIEELREKTVLPLEQYISGRPVLLATRAEIANIRTISDLRGETFLVKHSGGLVFLYPETPMSAIPVPDTIPVTDLRAGTDSGRTSPFNSERGLA